MVAVSRRTTSSNGLCEIALNLRTGIFIVGVVLSRVLVRSGPSASRLGRVLRERSQRSREGLDRRRRTDAMAGRDPAWIIV